MNHLTRCCGLSFTLHLVLAGALFLAVSREARQVRPITVSLEFLDLPELPRPKSAPPPERPTELRPPVPAATSAPLPVREPAAAPVQAKSPAPPAAPVSAAPAAAATAPVERLPEPGVPRDLPRQPALVGSTAAASSAAPAATVPQASVAPRPSRETLQQRYVKEHFAYIRELVTKRLSYPPQARRMNWSGKTVVSFVIQEDGSIYGLNVVASSSHRILDQAALDTVRSVAPFPRPPVRAEIVLPVHFALQP